MGMKEHCRETTLSQEPSTRWRRRNSRDDVELIGHAPRLHEFARLQAARSGKALVFVDLDGTIVSKNVKYYLPCAVLLSLPFFQRVWKAIVLAYSLVFLALGWFDETDFALHFLCGLSKKSADRAGRIASQWFKAKTHKRVVDDILALHRAGATVCVLTRNSDFLVRHFVTQVLKIRLGLASNM